MRTVLFGVLSAAVAFSSPSPLASHQQTSTASLTGRVVSGAGADTRPVRRAKVTLTGPGLTPPRIADTDTSGAYRFDALPAGSFTLRVQKPGFVPLDAAATPNATLTMTRGAAIEGIVSDAAGDPVWNVLVSALEPQPDGKAKTIAQTRTDDLGRYRLHSLPAGDYIVSAATDGQSLAGLFLMPGEKRPEMNAAYYPAASAIADARPVRVLQGRDATAIDVTFTPASPVIDPAAPPPPPRPDRNGTGRIAGVVSDGISGKPLGDARVLLLPAPGQGPRITHWLRTDAKGRFEYTALPAQRYTLQFESPRHVSLEYGQKGPGQPGIEIALGDGDDYKADVKLPRTSAIEGTVVDEFGDPAPGIRVDLARRAFVAGRTRIVPIESAIRPAPTDDRGHYRAANVQPGDYYVVALSGVYTDEAEVGGFAPTYFPGTPDAGGATPVTVAIGADATATLALVPAKTFSVRGTMVDDEGRPVGRGTIWLATPDRLRRMDFNLARGRGAPDGTFEFRNVPSGAYTLQAFGPPLPPPPGTPVEHAPLNLGAMRFGWTALDVTDQPVDNVVLTVSNGRVLKGQIVLEDDAAAPPKPDQVRVTALPVEFDSAPVGGGPPPSETRADWSFEVRSLSGLRRIFVNVASPAWALERITRNGQDISDTPVDFRTADLDGVEVVITSKVARVSGAVTDDKGPVAAYAVVIFPSDPTKWIDRSRFIAVGRPTQQGRFLVAGLPPEDYLAVALPSVSGQEYMDPDFLQQLRAQATSFTLNAGESKALELKLKRHP